MLEFALNSSAQLVKWGLFTIPFILAASAVAYLSLYLGKNFSLEKGLPQLIPISFLFMIHFSLRGLDSELKDYSKTQLSDLTVNSFLNVHKLNQNNNKESYLGKINCQSLTVKQCIEQIKVNKSEVIKELELGQTKTWSVISQSK